MPPKIGELTCLKSLSTFIVGSKEGYRLAEIRDLELAGELHIKGLKKIASALDARDANLIGKKDLQYLRLSWNWSVEKEPLAINAQQVLEALQPHSNLKSLTIECYLGAQFPNWIANISSLVFLQLYNCENCLKLPPLGKLPYLRSLEIDGMKYVQYIDDEPYDDLEQRAFMSLETIKIGQLPILKSFFKEERVDMFPCLSKLSIFACPKLRLPCLPSVKDLDISECIEELLRSISNCYNLTSLKLEYSEDLTSFPEGMMRNLSCLEILNIYRFIKLKVLPIELVNLVALAELRIESCPELESFPEKFLEGLCSLRTLNIIYCKKFRSMSEGVRHLALLERLEIRGCSNLEALPDGMNHLNRLLTLTIDGSYHPNSIVPRGLEHICCLRSLKLCHLHAVTSLPDSLGELTTLQSLHIEDCPKLITVPSSFQHLTNLQNVVIAYCPELEKQCKEETWDVLRAWKDNRDSWFYLIQANSGRLERSQTIVDGVIQKAVEKLQLRHKEHILMPMEKARSEVSLESKKQLTLTPIG
ncbi:hypothetical protein L6164_033403 [Bauhinia variegata]|uniref:Uncharacterized protein n=1 Tax=Bauhinia variegata TaxID=167791 RepID=A0ACB9KSG8_BAUVA|nr:hypothetical protein L6164_033403 [Bauhinia variegata]